MVLLKDLAVIASLASIATCSPLDSEASFGAIGVPPALGLPSTPPGAPLDSALSQAGLPHMPADLATGLLAPKGQKSEGHSPQVAKGVGQNPLQAHYHVEQQHAGLSLPITEEKALAPAAAAATPKFAIREVIERGIASIGARSDPPAKSFVQALSNMFSGLANDKSKRDAPPALPAPPGPLLDAVNASHAPPKDASPPPPAPVVPAPAHAEGAAPPAVPQSPPGSPPPASPPGIPPNGSPPPPPPPPANPPSAPADIAVAHPPFDSSPPQDHPAPPATPADAAVPPAAQALPASNVNPPSSPLVAPPAVDTGASSQPDSKPPNSPGSVPASPGFVAQEGHMGHFGPESGMLDAQQNRVHRQGAHTKGAHANGAHSVGSYHRGSHGATGHRAGHHRHSYQGMNAHRFNHHGSHNYGTHRPTTNHRGIKYSGIKHGGMKYAGLTDAGMTQYGSHNMMQTDTQQGLPSSAGEFSGAPSDFHAAYIAGPPASASMKGTGSHQVIQRRHYLNRRNVDFANLPRIRATIQAREHVYRRRDESSATAGASDEQAEKKASVSETPANDKPVTSDSTPDSNSAAKVDGADGSAGSETKEMPEIETVEKKVDTISSDKSKDGATEKAADSKDSEKLKADKADKAAEVEAPPKSDTTEASTESKAATKESKKVGSIVSGAKEAALKKHGHDQHKAHKNGGKGHHGANDRSKGRKGRVPAYTPRPKGQRTKPKTKRPAVSDHHSSRFNPQHKMIPQIARRHDLQVRNAAAEADALADAYANYLHKRNVYAEYVAKREAYAYPEAWACSDPSGCN
ncbi:hypothetical protein MMC11_007748 [Xylographa trunciseda]|nr:hypothetical protein [Xylographa trunciseda]